jgi:cytochrome c oxidase subunit 2
MWEGFPLHPESASTVSGQVDAVFLWMTGVSLFFTALIFVLVLGFAIRYRRRSPGERPAAIHGHTGLEVVWTAVPLVITMVTFVWGTRVYFNMVRPPKEVMDVYVVGKQWMWKFQHPDGRREINELHVPVGRAVRLTMASEDVIHSFFVPAFRIKMDVVPGTYRTTWFQATKAGVYHLFCAEYCGTKHSGMIGRVVALDAEDYEAWLGGGGEESLAESGAKAFDRLGCVTCHRPAAGRPGSGAPDGGRAAVAGGTAVPGRGPRLEGVFGSRVRLRDGRTVVADETYLRRSILEPNDQLVAGYDPLMPTFKGQITEETVLQLVAYIKSLSDTPPPAGRPAAPAPPPPARRTKEPQR